ncbi:BlaI/MecI/CopY family transcriptional regulator [Porticoccus sp. W117]|uniref:BlaI/MecI/CopY family transcriptional regulator n=1 Tax=Porticoccus sp. W117 TaxID=3054777 RepID=UPI002591ED8D|nr:BlaI/MecI/CopY family transcriptional regulator [Porticoccus sp. W117]MDM3869896.1 BlaI/MecI/CopY family transcriptional regulator [Porticoccus sp. W117]
MNEISDAELEVMKVLWSQSPLSANEVVDCLSKTKTWHEKTVKTLLSRLVKKQVVNFHKDGRRYLYFPLLEKSEYRQKASKNFINKLFSGRLAPFVSGFSQSEGLSKEDLEELKQLIQQWENSDG